MNYITAKLAYHLQLAVLDTRPCSHGVDEIQRSFTYYMFNRYTLQPFRVAETMLLNFAWILPALAAARSSKWSIDYNFTRLISKDVSNLFVKGHVHTTINIVILRYKCVWRYI